MLDFWNMEYEVFETDSEVYIGNWFASKSIKDLDFTELIWVGGDGLFSQMLNSIGIHKDKDEFFKLPIGIIPCGSHNALACDVGGKDPYVAATNIIRGAIVNSDMLRVDLKDLDLTVYGTALTWGIPSDIVHDSAGWRKWFGSFRYNVWGFKKFVCSCKFKEYRWSIQYKNNPKQMLNKDRDSFGSLTDEESKTVSTTSTSEETPPYTINDENIESGDLDPAWNKTLRKYSDDWLTYDAESFFFFFVLTHEAKNSVSKEIVIPFARVNDSNMYIGSLDHMGKLNALKLIKRMQSGSHIKMNQFKMTSATEVKISPITNSFFNIDGEIFPSGDATIKLLPSLIKLFGKVDKMTPELNEMKKLMS
jgi:diacylglycerol kinase family enzyme